MLGDLDLGNLEPLEAGSRRRSLLHLRRGDQMEAARQLRRLLPEPEARVRVLKLLAGAIRTAHATNTEGWGLSLNAGNIRLNVGQVAMVRLDREWVRLTLDLSLLPEAFLAPTSSQPSDERFPRRLPGCAAVWLEYQELAVWGPQLQPALHAAVEAASRAFRALHQPWRRAHSSSLLNCLRVAIGEGLPEPGWRPGAANAEPTTVEYALPSHRLDTEPGTVQQIIERLLPEPEGRQVCLEAFAASIVHAHATAPNRWSVSLSPGKVALNVGRVAVSSLHPGMLWRALDSNTLNEDARTALQDRLDAVGYSAVPGSTGLESDPHQLAEDSALVDATHEELIRRVAFTCRVLVRQLREAHSSEVLEYLRVELGIALPDPVSAPARTPRRNSPPAVLLEPLQPEGAAFPRLQERLAEARLHIPTTLLANYLLALQTKRFTLLCGISGTGKTRLAREVARFFNQAGGRTEVVAVRPDWTDHRGLLGYHNPITQSYHATPCLRLLLDAAAEVETARRVGRTPRPFFLILDEMNLARVEQYFSDFLSCLESGEALHLHNQPELERGPGAIPCVLPIPENLFITGTVNVDETTFMFSPKVLDRAFALEFNEVDLAGLVANGVPEEAAGAPLALGEMPCELRPPTPVTAEAARWLAGEHPALWETVTGLHALLTAHHRHFGYRVVNEVARFVQLASEQTAGEAEALWAALDLALLQKVLPKFYGMQSELEPVLVPLEAFAVRLPRFRAKVQRMLARVRATGFTAYME
jgi:hypothetical protein